MNVIGYVYKADTYCGEHAVAEVLKDYNVGSWRLDYVSYAADLSRLARLTGFNNEDESSYDSDDFPKVEFADGDTTIRYCCVCHERLEDE